MPGQNIRARRHRTSSGSSHTHDSEEQSQNQTHNDTSSNPTRILTAEQRHKERLRLYQAQRQGNWLQLKGQLTLPNTVSFDVDELGDVEWVRRADGSMMWLMKLHRLEDRGKAKVWYILKDAYVDWCDV
ncbi:hypothetical protein H2198_007837 [Neophaeococcomyces mojaviensis]|uniref:Uncharacterized protein n=1 Tax=Neophaeococcomyces mojaviensis TaxID=3383035 RepID=A0ACC2ZYV1_9EURO|nr:hypothetical protein H2198_007837 [Knufia sp. JES_112]